MAEVAKATGVRRPFIRGRRRRWVSERPPRICGRLTMRMIRAGGRLLMSRRKLRRRIPVPSLRKSLRLYRRRRLLKRMIWMTSMILWVTKELVQVTSMTSLEVMRNKKYIPRRRRAPKKMMTH